MRSEMTKQHNFDDHASFSAPIEDLQVRIAFLDDLVEQLNQQLAIQTKEIADLKKQMQILYQRVEASDLSEGIAPFDPMSNKPPHY
jgi:SlyX protein